MDTPFEHKSVLREPLVDLISPVSDGVYCDATLGGGGHAELILEASAPNGRLIGIDRDPEAVEAARKRLARFGDRVSIFHGRFSQVEELLEQAGVRELDGLVLDLGVSSHQLDEARRGFSFAKLGPLDMRMDTTGGETAATLLSRMTEDELADVIHEFGQERMARRVARSIKRMESMGALNSTEDLAVAVRRVVGYDKKGRIDPATRTFQAIRIVVNDELGELERLLETLPQPLAVGGTVAIITFHSLEDRMVKRRFARLADQCICPPGMPICHCPPPLVEHVTRRLVRVGAVEKTANRRSRSAKARAVRRIR